MDLLISKEISHIQKSVNSIKLIFQKLMLIEVLWNIQEIENTNKSNESIGKLKKHKAKLFYSMLTLLINDNL